MKALISLEIRRSSLRPYHRAALICSVTMLVFYYFMASIPLIDPTETDIGLFSSYEFLFSLNHLLSMAAFTILGSVMGARFIVEEYTGARAILLFSYPVSRRKIMGAKLCLVFFYSTAAMLLCGIATGFFFTLTECFLPICTDTMTGTMAAWIFFSLLFHSLLAWFSGTAVFMDRLSRKTPLCLSHRIRLIISCVVCQILSAVYIFHPALFFGDRRGGGQCRDSHKTFVSLCGKYGSISAGRNAGF